MTLPRLDGPVSDIGIAGTWVGAVGLALAFLGIVIRGGKVLGQFDAMRAEHAVAEASRQTDATEIKAMLGAQSRTLGLLGSAQARLESEVEALRRDSDRHERHFQERPL